MISNKSRVFAVLLMFIVPVSALCLLAVCHSMAQVNQMDGNFIKDWLMLGPFSGNDVDQDYLKNAGGKANVASKAGSNLKPLSVVILLICCRQLATIPKLWLMHSFTCKVRSRY